MVSTNVPNIVRDILGVLLILENADITNGKKTKIITKKQFCLFRSINEVFSFFSNFVSFSFFSSFVSFEFFML